MLNFAHSRNKNLSNTSWKEELEHQRGSIRYL